MSWLKPRSIRGQLISGLILFEGLLVIVFATLLVREQASEIHERARLRLESEVNLLVLQSQDSLAQGQTGYLVPILRAMVNSPVIRAAMVTDINGRVIASSDPEMNGKDLLTRLEKKHLEDTPEAVIFRVPGGAREAVQAIHVGGQLSGFAWVYEDASAAWQEIYSLIRITIIFAGLGALGTAMIAGTLARSITRPLRTLLAATRKLIRDPETKEGFPLEVTSNNEVRGSDPGFQSHGDFDRGAESRAQRHPGTARLHAGKRTDWISLSSIASSAMCASTSFWPR